jgi:hypothetical protein
VSPDARVAGILATDSGLVAYGARFTTQDPPSGSPTVWTHDALAGWSTVTLPVDARTTGAVPAVGLADRGTILLAGGTESSACAHPVIGTSWVSTGAGWTQSTAQPGDCWRQPEGFAPAPGGDGFLELTAATGEVYSAWRSTDGRSWRELASARVLGRTNQLFSIATVAGTTVVAGRQGGATSSAWATRDATSWVPSTLATGDTDALQVMAAGDRFLVPVARGRDLVGLLAWDGRQGSWAAEDLPPDATAIAGATSVGSTTVLVGTAGDRPAVWIEASPVTWRAVQLDAEPGAAQSVAVVDDTIVVLGWLGTADGDQVPAAWSGAWPIP